MTRASRSWVAAGDLALHQRQAGPDPLDEPVHDRGPARHVLAQMTSLPLALAGEGLQRPRERRAQDGQLAVELGRALDDLEQVGQPQHVGERHAPRQVQASPERARGRDVARGQLLAHRHLIAPAARHRRAHHGDLHAAALHLRPHALAQVALPGRVLAGQRDPDVEVSAG